MAPENTNTAAPNPFMIGITLKGASGFDAEWLTPRVYGATGEEVAKRVIELVKALADNGVIEVVSNASVYMRESHKPLSGASAPKRFENGQVVTKAPASSGIPSGECAHGARVFRQGESAKGPWAALFCGAPQGTDKSQQCKALFRQKDGSFT
ncbi:hypothetical protein [Streptomyces sp. CFMR 7]|uniref:hypothetical protein n=1 Tax=Streptomyces sp. CFMR 7 TaxID=1649184 RepID=UPI00119D5BE0|nr:hypothetical protein [Streptomyces sp. CFMR 7]